MESQLKPGKGWPGRVHNQAGSRRGLALVLCAAALAAGIYFLRRPAGPKKGTPEGAAYRFLQEFRKMDCATAAMHLSAAARQQLEAMRSAGQLRRRMTECALVDPYIGLVPETVALISSDGRSATVKVSTRKGTKFLIPGFWATEYVFVDHRLPLVHEKGAWKIGLPPESIRWR